MDTGIQEEDAELQAALRASLADAEIEDEEIDSDEADVGDLSAADTDMRSDVATADDSAASFSTPANAGTQGAQDEDAELQAALRASLAGADIHSDRASGSGLGSGSSSSASRRGSNLGPRSNSGTADDPVAASMARSRAIMEQLQREQEGALHGIYAGPEYVSRSEQCSFAVPRLRLARERMLTHRPPHCRASTLDSASVSARGPLIHVRPARQPPDEDRAISVVHAARAPRVRMRK